MFDGEFACAVGLMDMLGKGIRKDTVFSVAGISSSCWLTSLFARVCSSKITSLERMSNFSLYSRFYNHHRYHNLSENL